MSRPNDELRALWLDDKISNYGGYIDRLRELGFTIRKCRTNAEAIRAASKNSYDLVIVDLKLENETGLEFLRFLKDRLIKSTTVILSSFLYDQNYISLLKDLDSNVFLLEKNLPSSASAKFVEFSETLRQYVEDDRSQTPSDYYQTKRQALEQDPFDITYSDYLRLPPDLQDELHVKAFERVEAVIDREVDDGAKWLVFCGNPNEPEEVADDISDRWDAEELDELAAQKNRVAFVFEAPEDSEDDGCGGGRVEARSYPTVNLVASGKHLESGNGAPSFQSRKGGQVFVVHFDTGSHFSYLSYEDWIARTGDPNPGVRTTKRYRGKVEIMYEKTLYLRVQDQLTSRTQKAADLPVYLVKNFLSSKLVAECPSGCIAAGRSQTREGKPNCIRRIGLIGRNLLTENGNLKLTLTGNPVMTTL